MVQPNTFDKWGKLTSVTGRQTRLPADRGPLPEYVLPQENPLPGFPTFIPGSSPPGLQPLPASTIFDQIPPWFPYIGSVRTLGGSTLVGAKNLMDQVRDKGFLEGFLPWAAMGAPTGELPGIPSRTAMYNPELSPITEGGELNPRMFGPQAIELQDLLRQQREDPSLESYPTGASQTISERLAQDYYNIPWWQQPLIEAIYGGVGAAGTVASLGRGAQAVRKFGRATTMASDIAEQTGAPLRVGGPGSRGPSVSPPTGRAIGRTIETTGDILDIPVKAETFLDPVIRGVGSVIKGRFGDFMSRIRGERAPSGATPEGGPLVRTEGDPVSPEIPPWAPQRQGAPAPEEFAEIMRRVREEGETGVRIPGTLPEDIDEVMRQHWDPGMGLEQYKRILREERYSEDEIEEIIINNMDFEGQLNRLRTSRAASEILQGTESPLAIPEADPRFRRTATPPEDVQGIISGKHTLYHGTDKDFLQFDPESLRSGPLGRGVYATTNPDTANAYSGSVGGNVRPLKVNMEKIFDFDSQVDSDLIWKIREVYGPRALIDNRSFRMSLRGNDIYSASNGSVYRAILNISDHESINALLESMGYEGITHGVHTTPRLPTEPARPPDERVVVVFPGSIDKISSGMRLGGRYMFDETRRLLGPDPEQGVIQPVEREAPGPLDAMGIQRTPEETAFFDEMLEAGTIGRREAGYDEAGEMLGFPPERMEPGELPPGRAPDQTVFDQMLRSPEITGIRRTDLPEPMAEDPLDMMYRRGPIGVPDEEVDPLALRGAGDPPEWINVDRSTFQQGLANISEDIANARVRKGTDYTAESKQRYINAKRAQIDYDRLITEQASRDLDVSALSTELEKFFTGTHEEIRAKLGPSDPIFGGLENPPKIINDAFEMVELFDNFLKNANLSSTFDRGLDITSSLEDHSAVLRYEFGDPEDGEWIAPYPEGQVYVRGSDGTDMLVEIDELFDIFVQEANDGRSPFTEALRYFVESFTTYPELGSVRGVLNHYVGTPGGSRLKAILGELPLLKVQHVVGGELQDLPTDTSALIGAPQVTSPRPGSGYNTSNWSKSNPDLVTDEQGRSIIPVEFSKQELDDLNKGISEEVVRASTIKRIRSSFDRFYNNTFGIDERYAIPEEAYPVIQPQREPQSGVRVYKSDNLPWKSGPRTFRDLPWVESNLSATVQQDVPDAPVGITPEEPARDLVKRAIETGETRPLTTQGIEYSDEYLDEVQSVVREISGDVVTPASRSIEESLNMFTALAARYQGAPRGRYSLRGMIVRQMDELVSGISESQALPDNEIAPLRAAIDTYKDTWGNTGWLSNTSPSENFLGRVLTEEEVSLQKLIEAHRAKPRSMKPFPQSRALTEWRQTEHDKQVNSLIEGVNTAIEGIDLARIAETPGITQPFTGIAPSRVRYPMREGALHAADLRRRRREGRGIATQPGVLFGPERPPGIRSVTPTGPIDPVNRAEVERAGVWAKNQEAQRLADQTDDTPGNTGYRPDWTIYGGKPIGQGPGPEHIPDWTVYTEPADRSTLSIPDAAAEVKQAKEEISEAFIPKSLRDVIENAGIAYDTGDSNSIFESLAMSGSWGGKGLSTLLTIPDMFDKFVITPSRRLKAILGPEKTREILVAFIAEGDAENVFSVPIASMEHRLFTQIIEAFDEDSFYGRGTADVTRNPEARHIYSSSVFFDFPNNKSMEASEIAEVIRLTEDGISHTVKDIFENPHLYVLNDKQKAAIKALNDHDEFLFERGKTYGLTLGHFEPKPGGAYLTTIWDDPSSNNFTQIANEFRPVGRTSTYTRYYPTARDGLARENARKILSEKSKKSGETAYVPKSPKLNIEELIRIADRFKAKAVGGNAFKLASGGYTRKEIFQKLVDDGDTKAGELLGRRNFHYQKVQELRSKHAQNERAITKLEEGMTSTIQKEGRMSAIRLESIRSSIHDRTIVMVKGEETILHATLDDDYKLTYMLDELKEMDSRLYSVRQYAERIQNTADSLRVLDQFYVKELDREILALQQIINDIKEYLPNQNQYKFVPHGVQKYFPIDQANAIQNIRKESLGEGLYGPLDILHNVAMTWNQTVLSADLSPAFHQLPQAALMNPGRAFDHMLKLLGMKQATRTVLGRQTIEREVRDAWKRDLQSGTKKSWDDFVLENLDEVLHRDKLGNQYAKGDFLNAFAQITNIPLGGSASAEFRAGFVPVILKFLGHKVPGLTKAGLAFEEFNDAMYRMITRTMYENFVLDVALSMKTGYDWAHAIRGGGDLAQLVVPRIIGRSRVAGRSPYHQSAMRPLFTSLSFFEAPLAMTRLGLVSWGKIAGYGARHPHKIADPRTFFEGMVEDEVLTADEFLASRKLLGFMSALTTIGLISSLVGGYNDGLRGDQLKKQVLRSLNPAEDWGRVDLFRTFSVGASMASLVRNVFDKRPDKYLRGRFNAALRAGLEARQGRDYMGREINADNGLHGWVNWALYIQESVSPLALGEIPAYIREMGTNVVPPGIPGISHEDEEGGYQYGRVTTREALAEVSKRVAYEFIGTTSYEPSVRSEISKQAIILATKNKWPMTPDKNGEYTLYSLQENHRAQFEQENKVLFDKMKAEVQSLARAKVGTYDKQLELIENERKYITELDTIKDLLEAGEYATAWERFKPLRDHYYSENSRIFREIDIDEKEEPEDIGSNEHHMWRYRQLFDQSTTTTPGGYVEFDIENFGVLLEGLKKEWINEGHDTAWDYVKQQQRLIEKKYPEPVQDMVDEIRTLSDRGWWKQLDTSVLLPLLERAPGLEGKSDQIERYLNGSQNERVDMVNKHGKEGHTYVQIRNWYNNITSVNMDTGQGGVVGMQRASFIWEEDNEDLMEILHRYNFNFPGKKLYADKKSFERNYPSNVTHHLDLTSPNLKEKLLLR